MAGAHVRARARTPLPAGSRGLLPPNEFGDCLIVGILQSHEIRLVLGAQVRMRSLCEHPEQLFQCNGIRSGVRIEVGKERVVYLRHSGPPNQCNTDLVVVAAARDEFHDVPRYCWARDPPRVHLIHAIRRFRRSFSSNLLT